MLRSTLGRRLCLVLLILTGLFLRVHHLDNVPPGLSYDEGYNALEAMQLTKGEKPALFYPANYGREPLHIYLISLFLSTIGNRPWTMRLVSVFVGVLTIPLTYLLGRDLGIGVHQKERWTIGILAALLMATSFWHVMFSRFILRSIVMVPFLILAIWLFWRGQQRVIFLVFSGIMLGISLYTYLSARLMPLTFILFVLSEGIWLLISQKQSFSSIIRSRMVWGTVLVLVMATVVFAPLGFYFVNHPDAFWERVQKTSLTGQSEAQSSGYLNLVIENILPTVRMFFDKGEPEPWYNLSGRPAMHVIGRLSFFIGGFYCLWRLSLAKVRLLVIWLLIMLLPTLLSEEAPKFVRVLGVVPPMLVLASSGFYWLLTTYDERLSLGRRWLQPIALAGLLIFGVVGTYQDYFHRWPLSEKVPVWYSVAEDNLFDRLLQLDEVYDVAIPAKIFYDVSQRYTLESNASDISYETEPIIRRPVVYLYPTGYCRLQRNMILIHRASKEAITVYDLSPKEVAVGAWLRQDNIMGVENGRLQYGFTRELYQTANSFDSNSLLDNATSANFADTLCLSSYNINKNPIVPGDSLVVTLYWEQLQADDARYDVTLALVTPDDVGTTLENSESLQFKEMLAGQLNHTTHTIVLPKTIPPGKYQFHVFVSSSDAPLSLYNDLDKYLGVYARLGNVSVFPADMTNPDVLQPFNIALGEPAFMHWIGYNLPSQPVNNRHPITLTLAYDVHQPMTQDYTFFAHLINDEGHTIAQVDSEPVFGRAPTSMWVAGERLVDTYIINLPDATPPGDYTIMIGMYDWTTGERLPLFLDGQSVSNDVYHLPRLEIRE